jgi:N-acetyl-1-D-myo-inositol-2-amino-2-deoxy-alpha-D-glucopyranoside deacetylase
MDPDDLQFGIDDALVTTAIDGSGFYENKLSAMRAHATQISLESGFFALSNNLGSPTWSTEYFRLVRGQAAGPLDHEGRETDLFAGV